MSIDKTVANTVIVVELLLLETKLKVLKEWESSVPLYEVEVTRQQIAALKQAQKDIKLFEHLEGIMRC